MEINEEKALRQTARLVSAVFTPLIIPLVVFTVLFLFTYLRIMPPIYKTTVLGVVCCFTVMLPALTIFLFRKINRLTADDMHERKRRNTPYLFTIFFYLLCMFIMQKMFLPWYMRHIIAAAILVLAVCALCNLKWKISEHTAGAGAVTGGVVAYGEIVGLNPVWWLCAIILVSGILGSARVILGKHTTGEVMGGYAAGFVCSLPMLHPACYHLIHQFI